MKKSIYLLPKFIGIVLKKCFEKVGVTSNSNVTISRKVYNQFCLAALLLAWSIYDDLLPDIIKGSQEDRQSNKENFKSICDTYAFYVEDGGTNLRGLVTRRDNDPDDDLYSIKEEDITDLEEFLSLFFRYHLLRKKYKTNEEAEMEYLKVTPQLEVLRQKFRIPVRFEYNAFKNRDGLNSTNGILVTPVTPSVTELNKLD